ncbi:hypothetical protein EFA46_015395 (plasmid) [Halarchaeum sp. CBA1220]|uniref:hypothetical protein n=1 Tax=Halarchaeum sp. CBA1220 TaxID=1853682 RepID=UPI0011CDB898|nr:hypothetical protein [Halarchaeum sp. CBA1220]QLC35644.1 hypothetical protein EFA46_015395 [Halarchaeum sp. CBA1220]
MAATITVRISIVIGVALLVAGGGIYGYGAYDSATIDRKAGIDVAPTSQTNTTATDFSDLPREQQALFLLAVEPGQDGRFMTTDEELQERISELPYSVRYNSTIYDVSRVHVDVASSLFQPFGMFVTGIGGVVLLGAAASSTFRRIQGNKISR